LLSLSVILACGKYNMKTRGCQGVDGNLFVKRRGLFADRGSLQVIIIFLLHVITGIVSEPEIFTAHTPELTLSFSIDRFECYYNIK
jgi:hypothetical protein